MEEALEVVLQEMDSMILELQPLGESTALLLEASNSTLSI